MSQVTYQLLFHTTYGAIHLKKVLQERGIPFVLSDIPRTLSSGCGLSLRFDYDEEVIEELVYVGETAAIYRYWDEQYLLLKQYPVL